jgi:GGDEF domain-containing protein
VIVVEVSEIAAVNRDEGYAAGDMLIQDIAHAVQLCAVRAGGTAARISGRRLALLMPGADEATCAACADDLRRSLSDGTDVNVGTATWRTGEDGQAVVERARRLSEATPVG